ncbi:MAG: hypothetical protein IIY52_00690 [Solobacterium sp.]|nr:hypothetical protein [Solobacterium sp.]MBQ1446290.1 hypothetical protein [Solobacterium sp.]
MSIARKIAVCAALVLLCGCSSVHRITVSYGKDYMDECPSRAKEGETVRFSTVIAADADVVVKVSGTDTLIQVSEGVYEFTMPETDVEIEVYIIANNGA